METEKLFYQDQYIHTFTTTTQKQELDEKGRHYVVLKETYFYPTGGGQPHDTGTLNGVSVYGVEEVNGEIRHFTQDAIDAHHVTGVVDWDRRLDHMQQHAGQHILSASFEELFGYKTFSFHLGKELCSIDLETTNLSEEEAFQAEKLANTILLENRPIETKWITKGELGNYSLRKEVSVSDNIRLVIIPDFDYNGCGGTHPTSTGQVSSIKILQWEKQKKHIRVYFVCGNRVLKQLHEKQQVIQQLTSLLNAPQEKMKEAANRLLQQTNDLEKTVNELKFELLEQEASRLIEQAEEGNSHKTVQGIFLDRPISELQQMAKTIVQKTNDTIVLFINETEDKLQCICASSQEISIDMNLLVKGILPLINGKGGGNNIFAQGGGEKTISAEQLLEALVNGKEFNLVE